MQISYQALSDRTISVNQAGSLVHPLLLAAAVAANITRTDSYLSNRVLASSVHPRAGPRPQSPIRPIQRVVTSFCALARALLPGRSVHSSPPCFLCQALLTYHRSRGQVTSAQLGLSPCCLSLASACFVLDRTERVCYNCFRQDMPSTGPQSGREGGTFVSKKNHHIAAFETNIWPGALSPLPVEGALLRSGCNGVDDRGTCSWPSHVGHLAPIRAGSPDPASHNRASGEP
jgi:hypothetical protein